MAVGVRLTGFDEADRALERFGVLMSDLRGFWPMVVPLFIGWMREQFASEGEFFGDPWAELSPDYAAYKAQVYGEKPLLQREQDLRESASRPHRRVTPTSLELWFDGSGEHHGPIAAYHQQDDEDVPNLPRRKLVPDSEEELGTIALTQLDHAAESYVADVVRRLGL